MVVPTWRRRGETTSGRSTAPLVVRGDEKLAWLGLEQFIAFFQAGAAHEEHVRQLVDTQEQLAAYPERGQPVIGPPGTPRQRQSDLADVLLGHQLRMLRQLIPSHQLHPHLAALRIACLRRRCPS